MPIRPNDHRAVREYPSPADRHADPLKADAAEKPIELFIPSDLNPFIYRSGSAKNLLSLGSSRPRSTRGLCQHAWLSAMAQAARVVWRDLWASFPVPGLGGGRGAKVHLPPDPDGTPVEAFFVSTIVVGLAEIGDKRHILSLMLAARFLRPVPIIFGILLATIANHAAAGLAGTFFGPYSAYRGCGGYWGFHS